MFILLLFKCQTSTLKKRTIILVPKYPTREEELAINPEDVQLANSITTR